MVQEIRRRALGEQVSLTLRLNPTRPVWGDPAQIEQAVMNLVINARDAMPKGGEVVITTDELWLNLRWREKKGGRIWRFYMHFRFRYRSGHG